ncbi:DddA-like double-stranded DNA deaminase toxin [Streptomyces sp. NPDC007117]|uniref:DddA-like double-stranded DNA deaminase toxin n=1 Tax=Streptomyces sp. NPDC007117 TaxID=3154314 RepID=UPI003406D0D1
MMSGKHDTLWREANDLLHTSGMDPWPSKGDISISAHVETKYAAWMKSKKIQHAKVVINNTNGVCDKYMNCKKAVEAILPAGHTMEVHYPGKGSPKLIIGKRTRP